MLKQKINYWIDLILIILFLISAISGFIIWIFPHGPHSSMIKFLGILKYQWKILHAWISLLFIIFVLIHLILHWKWLLQMTKKIFTKKSIN